MARRRAPHQATEFNVRYPPWARSLSGGRPRIYRTFSDPRVGQAWVAQEKAKIKALRAGGERRAVGIVTGENLTFTAASGLWIKAFNGSAKTKAWYQMIVRAHLIPKLGGVRCSQVGRDEVLRFLEDRTAEGASCDARAKDLTVLRAVLRWAREGGHPVDLTAWNVKKPRVIVAVSRQYDPEIMMKLLDACETDRDRIVLEVALMTGMRKGELRAFDCSWIRWDQGIIHIPADQTFAPKSRKPRTIPLFARLESALRTWLGLRRQGAVFPPLRNGKSGTGNARGPDLRAIVLRAKKRAGLAIQGLHDLRHHYGSWLLTQGFDIAEVQEILGHSEVITTRKYIHLHPNFLAHARDRLNRADVGWDSRKSGGKVVGLSHLARKRQGSLMG